LGKADLHIHSGVSDGMAAVAEIMAFVQEETDLDIVSITDHDNVAGAIEALRWVENHPGCRFRVIFGSEITANLGRHLLAYFFKPPYPTEPIPRGRSYRHTIELVHSLGGIVVIPHPTVMWTPSGGYRQIKSLLRQGVGIEGVEVCNAAIAARNNEEKIREFNRKDFHIAELGGSDAHHLVQIGSGFTSFRGNSVSDLQHAIGRHSSRAHFGEEGTVTLKEHARQVFKSWVEKPTRGLRATLADW
jgi:predicted metal-dependent phosphoesterase TrpH